MGGLAIWRFLVSVDCSFRGTVAGLIGASVACLVGDCLFGGLEFGLIGVSAVQLLAWLAIGYSAVWRFG